jgi:hypothetical protein
MMMSVSLLTLGCSREEERPTLERAQAELKDSMEVIEARLAEGASKAKKSLAASMERWEELRPEAERAIRSLESRVEKLVDDSEALKRLPPDAIERIRARVAALRKELAAAKAAHEQGNTDLAVEKADSVQRESAAVEELLVERPD